MKANYLKEMFANIDEKNSLAIINQKQFLDSMEYSIEKVLEKKPLIFVSMTRSAEDVFGSAKEKGENMFVIDVFSREAKVAKGTNQNVIYVSNPANLTGIQIAINKALKKFPNATILFDSLGVLSVYSDGKIFQKFVYLFSNKMNLMGGTVLFFAVKGSMEEDVLSTVKQFCDRTYNFSELYIESIELAH